MPRTVRRDNGHGSLFFDESKQRWVGQLDIGVDHAGHRLRPKVFASTRTEASAKLHELRDQYRAGADLTRRASTFAELADEWLRRGLSPATTDNTVENYKGLISCHLLPSLGRFLVVDLRPTDVERLLDDMADRDYSARTMRLTLGLLRRILTFAERRGVVLRNVAAPVQAPRGPVRSRHGLTADQARALLAAAKADRLGALITVSLLLGLRPGEAAGLSWSDLDLSATVPTLTIRHSPRRTPKGEMVLVAPKTATSNRTLILTPACVDALTEQRVVQRQAQQVAGDGWANHHGLVFTTTSGSPLDSSNVRRSVSTVAKNAGLGHVHPHLLRHAAASLMSAAGVSLESISDTLGHKSINVTAEIYRHPIAPIRSGHLDAMSALTRVQPLLEI
jgi:integrase